MRKQLCMFGSAFSASVGMIALAVGVLTFTGKAMADQPVYPLLECAGCAATPPPTGCPSTLTCTLNGNALCPDGYNCDDCTCQGVAACACAI